MANKPLAELLLSKIRAADAAKAESIQLDLSDAHEIVSALTDDYLDPMESPEVDELVSADDPFIAREANLRFVGADASRDDN